MTRILSLPAAALLVALSLLLPSALATGVMPNSDMETDANSDGTPDGWVFGVNCSSNAAIGGSSTARSGSRSLSLKLVGGGGSCNWNGPLFNVTAGTTYGWTFWTQRPTGNPPLFLNLLYYDSSGNYLSDIGASNQPYNYLNTWQANTGTSLAPLGAVQARFVLGSSSSNAIEILVDDFEVAGL